MAAKNKFMNAMKMPAIADIFSSEAERQQMSGDLVTEVPLSELHPYAAKPLNQKMEYFNQHSTELQAYRNAAAYLEKEGIDQSVEIDKVNVLAQEMGHRMDELMEQLRDVNLQEQKVRQEQQTLAEIRSDLVE